MTGPRLETLEGRQIAQRKVLALLLARLPQDEAGALCEYLEERSTIRDAQEDPGAVPAPGVALEAALAEEFRLIAVEARRHMGRQPGDHVLGEG